MGLTEQQIAGSYTFPGAEAGFVRRSAVTGALTASTGITEAEARERERAAVLACSVMLGGHGGVCEIGGVWASFRGHLLAFRDRELPSLLPPAPHPHAVARAEFAMIVSAGATDDYDALHNDHHSAWERIEALLLAPEEAK